MTNYLYNRRIELGLAQPDIAQAVGVSVATVSRWENGKIGSMKSDKVTAYAKVLHTTPNFIMTGYETAEDEISCDEFNYALFNESKDLPDDKKKMLLEMARFFRLDMERAQKCQQGHNCSGT